MYPYCLKVYWVQSMKRKIYAYLRASTKEQDAGRAIAELTRFVTDHGKDIASFTTENESGTTLARPKLMALLNSMQPGDVLLLEQVDRLTRLNADDWQALKRIIESKGVLIVSLDLPTSHTVLNSTDIDEFTGSMLKAINGMMLDMLAAISRKDQDDRKRRQAEGIAANKHKFRGRPIDAELHKKVLRELAKGKSQRDVAAIAGCSLSTVQRVIKSKNEKKL